MNTNELREYLTGSVIDILAKEIAQDLRPRVTEMIFRDIIGDPVEVLDLVLEDGIDREGHSKMTNAATEESEVILDKGDTP